MVVIDNWSSIVEFGCGVYGLVFKGIFLDGILVVIKKFIRDVIYDIWDIFVIELEFLFKFNYK